MEPKSKKRLGILTGGGDCCGLNAAIRAITITAENYGFDVIGVRGGWEGLMEADGILLNRHRVAELISRGGTILGTSRTNPNFIESGFEKIISGYKKLDLYALIAIGGDGTLSTAKVISKRGLKVIGVPKTIDRDLEASDSTIGFDSSINIVMEAIDRLKTTAESHRRIMVLEVMGRHSGWIAALGGMAGGADYIVIPEDKFDLHDMIDKLKRRKQRGFDYGIVVAAEGAKPKHHAAFQLSDPSLEKNEEHFGGIGEFIAKCLREAGFEARAIVLGHVQRGGTPTAYDRVIATRLGIHAVEMLMKKQFGKVAVMQGNKVSSASLSKALKKISFVDKSFLKQMHEFFG